MTTGRDRQPVRRDGDGPIVITPDERAKVAALDHYERRAGELEQDAQLLRAEETRPIGWRAIAAKAALVRRARTAELTDPEPAIPISVRRVA